MLERTTLERIMLGRTPMPAEAGLGGPVPSLAASRSSWVTCTPSSFLRPGSRRSTCTGGQCDRQLGS